METKEKEYKVLTIPKLTWDKKSLTETFGELIAQPLEPGFGHTLGNALRRILLGAVEGAAVTSVVIDKVNNEFAAIPGVVEDAMQVVLNIKDIVIRNKDGRPGKMRLRKSGEAIVTVGDIEADEHIELINKDHVIAHIAAGGELDIEFFVENGRGYQPAQWPQGKSYQDDGRIYIDAMFSPIRRVVFEIEKARVGQDIGYDKLILQIHTDGSENPVDAIHYSVSVLRTQLEHFLASSEIPFNEISKMPEEEEVKEPLELDKLGLKDVPVELLLKPIEELELSVRAHNCLINAGIKRVIDLVNVPEEEALKIKNFGKKSLNEVKDSMKSFGLSFGMNISEEDVKKVLESRGNN
ncbi:DNA-directed RNA polymerase subunit alpha [Candidatus Dependentiae bacterium]|nr:MAG: DNA-directed RNA polymerase subunit alpha [Candidatus Dependentiae bacterium]